MTKILTKHNQIDAISKEVWPFKTNQRLWQVSEGVVHSAVKVFAQMQISYCEQRWLYSRMIRLTLLSAKTHQPLHIHDKWTNIYKNRRKLLYTDMYCTVAAIDRYRLVAHLHPIYFPISLILLCYNVITLCHDSDSYLPYLFCTHFIALCDNSALISCYNIILSHYIVILLPHLCHSFFFLPHP